MSVHGGDLLSTFKINDRLCMYCIIESQLLFDVCMCMPVRNYIVCLCVTEHVHGRCFVTI